MLMKIIRSSKCYFNKWLTKKKMLELKSILQEYAHICNYFVEKYENDIQGNIERVVITYKDRLSRIAFSLFVRLFKKFNCEIIVMSEVGSPKLDSEEVLMK